ncbi:S-layer homology domain-containing protein [Microcoleus sp. FACHB-68]|uniref:S-layer homology domain-containing protein n=1 Tax=Microcoleus sp. FACHB-68 TaxID=2692826 RepID=UPI001681E971|nr:S-layer homology domain-containing protein [Microcoleus sp. FACHB-68]MBD1936248.1 S-layer homology domain-containing protein [Microcoleus sp. FACHB-68]
MKQSSFALLSRIIIVAAGLTLATSAPPGFSATAAKTGQTPAKPASQQPSEIEKPTLLSQWQESWDTAVIINPVITNQEATAFTIQLEVLSKPATTYANAVYQLFVRQNDRWLPVYTSTGARLLPNQAGSLALEPEVIPITQVVRVLGNDANMGNLALKAVVQLRYDLQSGAKEQQLQLETSQSYGLTKLPTTAQQGNTGTPATAQTPIQQGNTGTSTTAQTPIQQGNTGTSTTPATTAQQPLTTGSPMMGKGQFSLGIRSSSDVIARISLKPRRSNGYLRERFIGDFRYKPNQGAKFMQGIYPGDRVVVRLYDLENRAIGYSEFELLFENTAVNLVVPSDPAQSRAVRTVYGMDTNADGSIDPSTVVYDYFTKISSDPAGSESVSFLTNLDTIDTSRFQAEGLLAPPRTSIYTPSLGSGAFSLANRTVNLFGSDLAPALIAQPGKVVQVINLSDSSTLTYDVSQLVGQYRDEGVSQGIQVRFADVPADHWAKDFIGELAAKEVLKGFLDGTFRPNEQVTRAEFAAMIRKAFNKPKTRNAVAFADVPASHWAASAIREAYEMGFFEQGNFNPDKKLDRLDILTILAKGLNYSAKGSPDSILQMYSDSSTIPADARTLVAAATEQGLVVNYPNLKVLNPKQMATRAEVAAFLYQALASTGDVARIASPYVVGGAPGAGAAGSSNQP